MNVYLSARYPRRAELRKYAAELAAHDIDVSSSWITDAEPGGQEAAPTAAHAQTDIEDLYASTVLVTFAEAPVLAGCQAPLSATRGGRHVEFGIAYETGILCIVVAPQPPSLSYEIGSGEPIPEVPPPVVDYQGENVFHLLPGVIRVGSWAEAKALLVAMRERELDARWQERIATIWDETIDSHTKGSE